MSNPVIEVSSLTKRYVGREVPALAGVDLDVAEGSCLGLVGPNGAGKTTLLGCLLGLLTPDAGEIRVKGRPPGTVEVQREIGYVPERLAFDRWMTGEALVAYHHALSGRPAADRTRETAEVLGLVELDGPARRRRIATYSRGMLQRLALAQALVGRPRLLFLDEPTSGVDPLGVLLVRRILRSLRADGVTIVFNSHQLDQLERVCDEVVFLRAGRVADRVTLLGRASRPSVLVLQWSRAADEPTVEAVASAVANAGAELLDSAGHSSRVRITAEEAAADVIRSCVLATLPLVAASPEGLESLFVPKGAV